MDDWLLPIQRNAMKYLTWLKVKPEVLVLSPPSLAHFSGVTCLATRECVDLM